MIDGPRQYAEETRIGEAYDLEDDSLGTEYDSFAFDAPPPYRGITPRYGDFDYFD